MKIAVITGSASGIGACIKNRMEAQGYKVIGIDLQGQEIDADLSTPEGRQYAIETTLKLSNNKVNK